MQDRKKTKKKTDRRVSVGDALGLQTPDPAGSDLNEARAIDTALEAARHLNKMAASGKTKKGRPNKKRRSSIALMAATKSLF